MVKEEEEEKKTWIVCCCRHSEIALYVEEEKIRKREERRRSLSRAEDERNFTVCFPLSAEITLALVCMAGAPVRS